MKTINKILAGALCIGSSLTLLVTPASAFAPVDLEVRTAVATFPDVSAASDESRKSSETAKASDEQKTEPVSSADQETSADQAVDAAAPGTDEKPEVQARISISPSSSGETVKEDENVNDQEESAQSETLLISDADAAPAASFYEKAVVLQPEYTILAEQTVEEIIEHNPYSLEVELLPDFDNLEIWQNSMSPYHKARLWGQCTWFSWHRFYEIYGFSPEFNGNGYEVAYQLVNAHPDEFTLSSTPVPGAIYSYFNHTGVVLAVSGDGILTIQDCNYDGVTNYDWNEAISDWATFTIPVDEFLAQNPGIVFANPVNYQLTVKE